MSSRKQVVRALIAIATLGLITSTAPAAQPGSSAELTTYQREGGQTFFALSLTPPAAATEAEPHDVIILFDTSASQAGEYRDVGLAAVDACIAKLGPQDRVHVLAVDLDARAMSDKLVPAAAPELRAALDKLRNEPPLGATDMEQALRSAASRFDAARPNGRSLLYVGDGQSTANLLGTEAFRKLVEELTAARIPVSSYAIGPECDGRLLAALANQTGGNLYVAEALTGADAAQQVTADRAHQENLRRGAEVGASMADWTRATVLWPAAIKWPAELGDVYPKTMPPLRTDRDSVVVGRTSAPLDKALTVKVPAASASGAVELTWTVKPQGVGSGQSFLAQVVELARADGGVTLPTVGSAGLAETGRLLESNIDGLTDLAERAVSTGDVQAAEVAAQAVLQRDPGNVQAQTVQRVVERRRDEATRVAQAPTSADAGADLNLVRPAETALPTPPPPTGAVAPADSDSFPAEGALTDQFADEGALLDRVEQQRRVFSQMLRREIENTVIDARRQMNDNPDAAIQELKLALQNVEQAPELGPDVRAQLLDKLQIALREAQRAASIKDELDAAREEEMAAARERRMLNERMARSIEKEKQLMERFNALVDEARFDDTRFDQAIDVAGIIEEVDPEGVTPRVAGLWARLARNHYMMEVARATRWRNYFDTLYQVELSSIPFPDDPPIVYPDAPWWKEMSIRRKEKYGSMDLSSTGDAEERIEKALRSPLKEAGLDYVDQPLAEVVNDMQELYGIPIQLDTSALDDLGLGTEEPITVALRGITLRSALRLMLKDLGLTYIIQDEVLLITTPDEAEQQLVVKVYPVADLVLPIEIPSIGGQGGGGIGGQQGGQGGGGLGGGGGGGFGGGGGGFGGGGQGGGGGGFFSVPDGESASADGKSIRNVEASPAREAVAKKPVAIAIDTTVSPDQFWNGYFAREDADPAAVRATVRQLMGKKQHDQVIALIQSALRNGQPQSWMYESLGIAMELGGRSKSEIERAVMSAADFTTAPDELMYIAQYLSRLQLDRRAMQLYQQVTKLEPLRSAAYALGLRAAQRCEDLAGIQWATVGILSQAWPDDEAGIQLTASRVAKATLAQMEAEGKTAEHEAYLKELQEAVIWDCVVQVSWTGNADVDLAVEEPSGTVCSLAEPRTAGGGVALGDSFAAGDGSSGDVFHETYACPKGFAGTYRARIKRVWGEVTADKVTVDVYKHLRSGEVQHERRQLALDDKNAMVVFDLERGRRTEPLAATQLAGAVKRQQAISRSVLAQQMSSGADDNVLPVRPISDLARQAAFFSGRGAVGYQPIIQVLPEGTMFAVSGVVSADRRYVRISVSPIFSTIGDVQTVTFAGRAEPVDDADGNGDGTGAAGGTFLPGFNFGGGGFGGR